MAYIRMMRSGGLHCSSNAVRFIPTIDDVINIEELCQKDGLSMECRIAAK